LPFIFQTNLDYHHFSMAPGEDNSSSSKHLMRNQKRSEYRYSLLSAQKNWQGLHDDLYRIGHQYFDYSADLVFIDECLHDAWDELIHIAKGISSESPEHDRLLALVISVRELGLFKRKPIGATPDVEEEVAIFANDQRLWTDLPYLAQDFQNFWIHESMSLPASERENLATLTAKLCAAGICSVDLAWCALWLFKEVLETDRPEGENSKDSRPSLSDLLPVCVEWLNYGNFKLAKLCADNCQSAAGKTYPASMSPGPLALKANIKQQGFSVARWLFWRQRLGELYLSGGEKVKKSARKGFEVMALTGLAVGIQIPGERKYLERLFEALDKELAALDGPGCVVPANIEIDPTWTTE
jgi:hypothetical protein